MGNLCDRRLSARCAGRFLRRNIFLILSFLIPAAIMLTAFALKQIMPFGNRMLLVVDSWHQYYPFLKEYQRLLKEGILPFYTFNVGGGANFLGIIADYLGSPLYLLTYFLPSGEPWLAGFLTFTVVLRIGSAGLFAAIFLKRTFKRNDLSIVYFSMMYALCAYILGYYWNMMWLDSVALMPLVISGVITVLREKRFSLYIVSLALCILFNFYIGYFVCLFVLIFSVCYTVVSFVSFKESIKNAGKMLGYSALAILLTSFVTIPAFLVLQSSDSAGAVTGFPLSYSINTAYEYSASSFLNTLKAIGRTVTNMLAYTRPIVYDSGLPNIACGVLPLVLLPFYFVTKKISLKEKITSICVLVFFILSFVINQLNFIWHGMSYPAMVYYRFSFLFSFAVLILAYRAFTLIDSFGKRTFIVSSALLLIYTGLSLLFQRKLSVLITAVAAAGLIVLMLLYRKKKLRKSVFSLLLCLFVICEMSLSAYYAVMVVGSSDGETYPLNSQEVSELSEIASADSGDDIFYRTEYLSPDTLNDPAIYSTFGISTFNSMCNSDYTDMMAELGLSASVRNNRYVYYESTPVTNLFLNIKYLIGRDGEKAQNTAYLKEIATADECTLYENTAYIPMGFMADSSLADYETSQKLKLSFDTQNELFSLATGIEKDVFTYIEPSAELYGEYSDRLTPKEDCERCFYLDLTAESGASRDTEDETATLYTEYEISEDGSYYGIFYSSRQNEKTTVHCDNGNGDIRIQDKYRYITSLGEFRKGDVIKVEFSAEYGKNNGIINCLARLDDEVFREGVDRLSRNTMTVTERGSKYFKANINTDRSGLLYTSVLYDSGFKVYVDGEAVDLVPIGRTFSGIRLTAGEHTVEFRYSLPGIHLGVTLSAVAVLILAIMLVIKFFRGRHAASQNETLSETASRVKNGEGNDEVEREIERIAEAIEESDKARFFRD